MLDIPSITGIIAALGVIIGVVFTVLELRNMTKTRQADLVLRLYTTFGSQEFQEGWTKFIKGNYKDYNDFMKNYVHRSEPSPESTYLFEALGVLLKRNLIEFGLVDDLFTGPGKWFWEKLKPIAEDTRKQFNYPQYAEHIEYLYDEIKKREQRLPKGP
jgi:hypothetical protein